MDKEALRNWRTGLDIKLVDFARMLDVRPSTVVRWENGERAVPPYMKWIIKGIECGLDDEEAGNGTPDEREMQLGVITTDSAFRAADWQAAATLPPPTETSQ